MAIKPSQQYYPNMSLSIGIAIVSNRRLELLCSWAIEATTRRFTRCFGVNMFGVQVGVTFVDADDSCRMPSLVDFG